MLLAVTMPPVDFRTLATALMAGRVTCRAGHHDREAGEVACDMLGSEVR
jgi:hypothetical protein